MTEGEVASCAKKTRVPIQDSASLEHANQDGQDASLYAGPTAKITGAGTTVPDRIVDSDNEIPRPQVQVRRSIVRPAAPPAPQITIDPRLGRP